MKVAFSSNVIVVMDTREHHRSEIEAVSDGRSRSSRSYSQEQKILVA